MIYYIISNSMESLQIYLVIDNIRFAKIILLSLIICYLRKLKHYHFGFSKNDCMFKENWSNIELLPQFA